MTQRNGSLESSNLSKDLGANGAFRTSSNDDIFAKLRESVNLADLAREYTELKRSGSALLGRCPSSDHDDRTPSFYVYDDHLHCYGCGWHGDVTDLYRVMNGIASNIEAAQRLCEEKGFEVPVYSEEARQIAVERRQRADELLTEARRSHDALEDHPKIAEYWESRGFDADTQRHFLLGADGDGAATIPLWNRGEVHGLIRRNLSGKQKYKLPRNENLLDGHRPLFIPGKLGEKVCLVEGYVDAITLDILGFAAVAVGGTGMSVKQRKDLERIIASYGAMIYVLPDADEEGMKAARKWTTDLYPNARLCRPEYGTTKTTEE